MPAPGALFSRSAVCGSTGIRPAGSCRSELQRKLPHRPAERPVSGRKTLATARAARCDYPAAALGGHARAEAVAPLADELGWLIGALHLFDYRGVRPFLVQLRPGLLGPVYARGIRADLPFGATTNAPGGRPERAAAYRNMVSGSQLTVEYAYSRVNCDASPGAMSFLRAGDARQAAAEPSRASGVRA